MTKLTEEQMQMQRVADGLMKRAKHKADRWFLHYLKEKGYYLMSQEQLDKIKADCERKAVEKCVDVITGMKRIVQATGLTVEDYEYNHDIDNVIEELRQLSQEGDKISEESDETD